MATRKMTFSLPTGLAAQFVRRVSARDRSRYVAEALAAKLRERDRMLARAAEVANRSRQVRAIELEFDRLGPELEEPWDDAPSR
jgi:ubiquinone biosynthesis protein UbiJ